MVSALLPTVAEELIQETPSALALIICDQMITDERSKKKTLVGIFNNLNVKGVPAFLTSMVVFVSVRGGAGTYTAKLRLCHQDTDETVMELGGSVIFQNPFHVVEIAYNLINLRFVQSGPHCFEFYCNEELILSRPFKVQVIEAQQ
jgi:hypothetical protein